MRYSESDIVEDILKHIRQAGGGFREWRVGTASDAQASMFQRHESQDSEGKLIYREAYTTFAAEEVVERLTQGFDLLYAQEAAPNGTTPRRPGKVVFVYRESEAIPQATADPALHKIAASTL